MKTGEKILRALMMALTLLIITSLRSPTIVTAGREVQVLNGTRQPAVSDSYEPDNIPAEAKTIIIGSVQTHSIQPATDIDWVKFELTVPSAVILEMKGVADGDTRMWLYNSSLAEIRFSDDEGEGLYSYINTCDLVKLPAGTYYVKVDEFNNDSEISSYQLSLIAGNNCLGVGAEGSFLNAFPVYPGASIRQSLVGLNSGPVQVWNIDGANIIAAERAIYKVNGVNTSFSEMMGLQASEVDSTYWLPWYNNVDLDTQLRIGNVSGSHGTVHIFIGGVQMPGSPFILVSGTSLRLSFPGVNDGPVKIISDVAIVAAERVIYKVDGVNTSFSEMMALPDSQSDIVYWLPWYNNVDLDTQLRIGNLYSSNTNVSIYIDGQLMPGSPFRLRANASIRVSFPGINSGPVHIFSEPREIVVAERVIYKVNGVNTSFSEMMAVPTSRLSTAYWLPWYNSVTLDSQLRFANLTDSTANVNVYIGGQLMPGSPFTLGPRESTRVSFPDVDSGPVQVVSDVEIIASERVIYKVNGVNTSFSELMGLPGKLLDATYWFPWYNNVDLDTQLRFGVP